MNHCVSNALHYLTNVLHGSRIWSDRADVTAFYMEGAKVNELSAYDLVCQLTNFSPPSSILAAHAKQQMESRRLASI